MAKDSAAKKPTTIHDFLPEHEPKVPMNVKIRASVFQKAGAKRVAEGRTWVEIIEAALLAYAGGSK